ncbi:hypothetical protein DPMN_161247 [Dreissena polymorpha]|uniref:Uncharacterized protein n=1 Tax=Dreissena polymorpha TaxID=45954 RepID=A0A9D4ERU8_DREPO|nr:hypothetical protein DPMN_161247 [Dreissena polymorpha]
MTTDKEVSWRLDRNIWGITLTVLVNSRSDKNPVPTKRIQNIIDYLTYESFRYTCRGLYESHKFLFVLLMTLKIDLQQGKVKHDEFQTFIKGKLNFVHARPISFNLIPEILKRMNNHAKILGMSYINNNVMNRHFRFDLFI